MSRVLVTGATGFIGSHCLAPLRERGFQVIALHRKAAPAPLAGVSWVPGDVMDRDRMRAIFNQHPIANAWHGLDYQLTRETVFKTPAQLSDAELDGILADSQIFPAGGN